MTPPAVAPPPLPHEAVAPSVEQTLRRLFLTVFLRGRSSRGLRKETAPKSVGQKLALTLLFYSLFGLFALTLTGQPVFALSVYLHALTFVFLGMFIAASSGEVLFNKEEGDILLHRPITPKALLRAKIGVLVQVSLWLAGAFNLAGFFVGLGASDGGWLFPVAHAMSTTMEALFCTGCVVLIYQLCLRWFGRERLDGLMTTAQVFVAVAAVLAGQILPRMIFRFGKTLTAGTASWWIGFLPPAWFAAFDDAIAGHGSGASWALAALGLAVTAGVLWLAFGKLAGDYQTGWQNLSEALSVKPGQQARRRWLPRLVQIPPLSWWLRDPVSRASFLLTAAYLFRDRDVKLRVYPGLAPVLMMPFIFLLQTGRGGGRGDGGFGIAFSGIYLGLLPLLGLNLLRYSQQWQAADLFRAAPMPGPTPLCDGARRAVLLLLTLPMLGFVGLISWLIGGANAHLALLLPGIIAMPIYSLIPCLGGKAVPFSVPTEEAKAAGRVASMIVVMLISAGLAGLAYWSWSSGWFKTFLLIETFVAVGIYTIMRVLLAKVRWPSEE